MAKKVDQTQSTGLSQEQRAVLRRKAQTDLYWLAKEVLGYDLVPHVHQEICDTYVRKDPDKNIYELSGIKTRMVLAPRGVFKTTIDLSDIIQWILNYPDIRILLLTGTQDLVWRMVGEVKRQFQSNDTLRELFPEMCPPKDKRWGTDDEFTCPARTKVLREPTLSSSTLDSIKAGIHVEVLAVDDAVNEVNSTTVTQCQKTIDAFDSLTYVLEPGGYTNINGTRYKSYDLYGKLLERHNEVLERIERDANDPTLDEEDREVVSFQSTILAAWTLKPGVHIVRNENGAMILKKDDVDLLFPERLKFRSLYKQYRDNPNAFCCQMLNDPMQTTGDDRPFTDHLIESHTVGFQQMPMPSSCTDHIMWDFAGTNQERKSAIDYSVGVVGRLSADGRLYIIDMVRGKWDPTQLATQIVLLARSYPSARMTQIEDSVNARLLEPTIAGIAGQCGMSIPIRWVKIPRFLGAKRYRIDSLAQFFRAEKLFLASWLPFREELKTELLSKNPAHDDLSDAIALLVKELGMVATVEGVDGIPNIVDKKAILDRMFEAAIYGDDDTYTERYVAEESEPEPQKFESSILGYGFL